jgi:hypothetical protein
MLKGIDTKWLGRASENFDEFVAVRRGVQTPRGVPSTAFRYVCGPGEPRPGGN